MVAALGAVALAVCARFHVGLGWSMASLALLGFGIGPAMSTSVLGPQSVVPRQTRSVVTSAVYSTRMIGGALAIALLDLLSHDAATAVVLIAPMAVVGGLITLALSPATAMRGDVDVRELSAAE